MYVESTVSQPIASQRRPALARDVALFPLFGVPNGTSALLVLCMPAPVDEAIWAVVDPSGRGR